jgi:hypothetical protein
MAYFNRRSVQPPSLRLRHTRGAGMAKFTVRKGGRYRATIKLTGLKRLAGNDTIAGIFRKVGFTQVKVEGDGGTRVAEGLWALEDASADIRPEVTKVTELDEAPIPTTRLASAKRKRG